VADRVLPPLPIVADSVPLGTLEVLQFAPVA
jgi:hypothetical protein